MSPSAVFFDLDGTLIGLPGSELRYLRTLWHERRIGPRQIASGLLFYPRWFSRYGGHVGRKNKAFLHGLGEADLRRHGADWVERHADSLLLPGALALIEEYRRRDYRLVLMTGTLDFIAEPFARRLQMHDCIATRCASDGGHLLAAPPTCHPYGPAKLRAARAWCSRQGLSVAACAACGDSIQDAALLAAVGEPVAVNPDRKLRRLAATRCWRVVQLG